MISNIYAKNNNETELEVVEIVRDLCKQYDIPAFTYTVCIEKGSIPHSHPELTLNTRTTDRRTILKTLIHEQFHWYAQNHSKYEKCIEYLKTKYQDDGEHNKSGTYPNSYWEHIIVCFNTRKYLSAIIPTDFDWTYDQWQAYPTLEKYLALNYEEVMGDLKKFDLII